MRKYNVAVLCQTHTSGGAICWIGSVTKFPHSLLLFIFLHKIVLADAIIEEKFSCINRELFISILCEKICDKKFHHHFY